MRTRKALAAMTLATMCVAGAGVVGTSGTAGAVDFKQVDLVGGPNACGASGGTYSSGGGKSMCTWKATGKTRTCTTTTGGSLSGKPTSDEHCSVT